MNLKELKAPLTTEAFDKNIIEAPTQNIYEAIVIMAKRAEQINIKIKTELINKLDDFASNNDTLEEIFENREQIEVSKFYEKLPKAPSIAIQEWINSEVYFRRPDLD